MGNRGKVSKVKGKGKAWEREENVRGMGKGGKGGKKEWRRKVKVRERNREGR